MADWGAPIAEAMIQYHKEHQAYDQQAGIANALSRLAITEDGSIVPMPTDAAGGTGASKKSGLTPIVDPKALELFQTNNAKNRAVARGQMEALSRIGLGMAAHAIAQHYQDTSVSGKRTAQITRQSEEMFPLEKRAAEDTHEHMQKVIKEEDKVDVPGFGKMTPAQLSAHQARMSRVDALNKKSEPALNFENQLKNKYGLGAQDIVEGLKPQEFTVGKKKYTGTPFYNSAGDIVSSDVAKQKPDETFVHIGANKIAVPLFDKKGGLGWTQIMGKAQQMLPHIQANQIIARIKLKDPDELTEQDQTAFKWAKEQLLK